MRRRSAIWLLTLLMAAACETPLITFEGPYFARFSELSLTELESYSEVIPVEIHLAAPALDDELSVYYDITGTAREGVDFKIIGTRGEVQIEKGTYFGAIAIQLINNANNILRSQTVEFTLRSTSNPAIAVGQSTGGLGTKFTLTIQDDCILGGNYLAGRSTVNTSVSITSQDCETYTLSNWNVNVFQDTTPMDLIFKDNGDNTLTIPEQEESQLDESVATIRGTGVVDPVTQAIVLTITLVDFDNQPIITLNLKRN